MDQFADRMIARGPTLAADRTTWTGSLHIVDLSSADAAREFVEREPYNRAGLFDRHVIRRFENLLGRTMWQFPGNSLDPRFVVIAHVGNAVGEHPQSVPGAGFTDLPRERLILHGKLFTPDEAAPAGFALALQAPTREAVEVLLGCGPAGLGERMATEVHDWEFGGRR
jgi:uncharacterized protein